MNETRKERTEDPNAMFNLWWAAYIAALKAEVTVIEKLIGVLTRH